MALRPLGKTDLWVSRIALGTVKFGRNQGVKYPQPFELPNQAAVDALLEGALAYGINCLDTAPAYGLAEERLAPFIARHRDELVICTKAGEEFAQGVSHHDFSPAALRASVERSLRRLGVETLDIVLLHSDGNDAALAGNHEVLSTLAELKRAGKARAVGISAKTEAGVRKAIEHLDVVMAPFNRDQAQLEPALEAAWNAGLGVMTIKALASGHLATIGPGTAAARARDALRFVLERTFPDCVVVGSLDLRHIEEAVRAAGSLPIL